MTKLSNFAKYAWFVVAYNIGVILWGAVVRATGSGAGCGSHWPTCNGEVVHLPQSTETFIELFHRLSSAVDGLLIIALVLWAFRAFEKQHPARFWSVMSLVFVIIEGLLGAALVRYELVVDNASVARAIVVSIHLANTLILVAMSALTAWFGSGGKRFTLRGQGPLVTALAIAWVGTILIGSSGAVTALGDTLFPAESLIEGLRQDFDPMGNFLVQLRIYHPLIAIAVSLYTGILANTIAETRASPVVKRLSRWVIGLYILQLAIGALNVVLLAPVWMQLVHLLMADVTWIALILFSAAVLAEPSIELEPAAELAGD